MITEMREILALAVRALMLCVRREPPRKRIYLKRRDDDRNDSVENIWAGHRGFLQLRKARSQHRRKT